MAVNTLCEKPKKVMEIKTKIVLVQNMGQLKLRVSS